MVAYGIAVLVLGGTVVLSRDRTTLIMSLILGGEWLICNVAVGHDRFYLANPASIASIALAITLMTQLLPRTRLTLTLAGIYAASMGLACWAALASLTLERWYFDAINGTFALRLLVVGAWGVRSAICNRRSVGRDWPRSLSSRPATMVKHRPF